MVGVDLCCNLAMIHLQYGLGWWGGGGELWVKKTCYTISQ